MTIPRLIGTDFGGPPDAPLLLLGPSVGTSVAALWGNAAERLGIRHGSSLFEPANVRGR